MYKRQVHISKDNLTADLEKVKTEDEAKAIAAACDKKQAVVSSLKKETKTVNPVSYTHLDVYKRQVCLPCRKGRGQSQEKQV